jgi:hypothetical protein
MSLLNTLLQNKELLGAVAGQLGTNEEKAGGVLSQLGGSLLGQVKNNITSSSVDSSGLESLITGGNFGSILENTGSFLGGSDVQSSGIEALSQITGSKDGSRKMAAQVAEKTGFDISSIKKILPMVAPLLLGAMSKNTSSSSGIGGLMGMLDADGDGDTDMGDIIGLASKFF